MYYNFCLFCLFENKFQKGLLYSQALLPLQYSCLGNPIDRGSWRLQSIGSQRVSHNGVTGQQQQTQVLPGLCFGTQQVSIHADLTSVSLGLARVLALGPQGALSMLIRAWFLRTCFGRCHLEEKVIPQTEDRVTPDTISVPLKYTWTPPRVIRITLL